MTTPELLGIFLAVVGLAFAFETPRNRFIRLLRLHNDKSSLAESEHPAVISPDQTKPAMTKDIAAANTAIASSITVQEIVDTINDSPPFQREAVAAQYSGIAVQWEGFLRDVRQDPRDKDLVLINLIGDQSKVVGYSIWFSERPERIPEIKTLLRDSRLRVAGTIQSASGPGLCVTIKPESVAVLERMTA